MSRNGTRRPDSFVVKEVVDVPGYDPSPTGALVLAARTDWGASGLDKAVYSVGLRTGYWTATWDMIREHPWLGVGPGRDTRAPGRAVGCLRGVRRPTGPSRSTHGALLRQAAAPISVAVEFRVELVPLVQPPEQPHSRCL